MSFGKRTYTGTFKMEIIDKKRLFSVNGNSKTVDGPFRRMVGAIIIREISLKT